jgi:hypothetical protein
MKDQTLARLQLLAELRRVKILDEMAGQTRTLREASGQKQLLAAYRDKLSESWRGGTTVEAGQARRAMDFITASQVADKQITLVEQRAEQALDQARSDFIRARERERHLAEARQAHRRHDEHCLALRIELARTPGATLRKAR